MKRYPYRLAFTVLTTLPLLAATTLQADSFSLGDARQGEALHQQACVACHTTTVYTRPNRSVNSYGGLVGRVGGCSTQLQLNLTRDQVNNLVKYLNDNYYKLDPEK